MFIICTFCDMLVNMTTAINFTKTKYYRIAILYIIAVFYINTVTTNRKT